MKKEILKKLEEIERENNVKILWAIESGSRAWDFASEDSDYDIRCMHVGKIEDYLGLFPPKKQINFSDGKLDIESWDIKKFAELTIKSNPQIAEWLRSPIIYKDSNVRRKLKNFFDMGCSLDFLKIHYLRMAKQNYHKYMATGLAHSCKKYLYVLRGIACANFIEKNNKLPPLPYKEVISYLPKEIRKFFEKCVIQKNETEKAEIVSNKRVPDYIEKKINNIPRKSAPDFKKVNELNCYIVKIMKNN